MGDLLKKRWKHLLGYAATAAGAYFGGSGGLTAVNAVLSPDGAPVAGCLVQLLKDPVRLEALGRVAQDPTLRTALQTLLGP
jgi:hypothetical protein